MIIIISSVELDLMQHGVKSSVQIIVFMVSNVLLNVVLLSVSCDIVYSENFLKYYNIKCLPIFPAIGGIYFLMLTVSLDLSLPV